MAYVNQEKKSEIQAALKKAIPANWKWSLAVRHHSTIVLTIAAAPIDLIAEYTSRRCSEEVRASCLKQGYLDANPYHWRDHFEGDLLATFTAIFAGLNLNNHDRSDLQSDYFDVGHYVSVHFGKWDKPFVVMQTMKQAA